MAPTLPCQSSSGTVYHNGFDAGKALILVGARVFHALPWAKPPEPEETADTFEDK